MWWRRTLLHHIHRPLRSSLNPPCLPPHLPYSDAPSKRGKAAPLQERKMVDRFRVSAKGGEGGKGCWSFRRSRTDQYGRPDGGSGGRGGDVILECSHAVWDFSNLHHHMNAKRGGNGVSKGKIGSRGSDKIVQVPVGTVVHLVSGELPTFVENTSVSSLQPWEIPDSVEAVPPEVVRHGDSRVISSRFSEMEDCNEVESKGDFTECSVLCPGEDTRVDNGVDDDGLLEMKPEGEEEAEMEEEGEEMEEEEEEIEYSVAELTESGQRIVVARGGEGGLGNGSLKKDSKSRISSKSLLDDESQSSLTAGMLGSEALLILELKSIADVGLVGMPNAGKSTLLGAISRAKPAVGHYAFTTLRPNIGNLSYEDFFSVTVADIPGLIRGAHENRGLGHAFLRHIERTKVLAYVVDLAAGLNGRKGIMPWEQLRDLVLELEHHQEGLSNRPSLVVANKIDEEGAESVYEELQRRVRGVPMFPVCAVLEEGVPELKAGLRRLMDGSESQRLSLDKIMTD